MLETLINLGRTNDSLILDDMIFDFCKKISDGADVSYANVTMRNDGAGAYTLINPDVTEDAHFIIHATADSSIESHGVFSLADGDLATQTKLLETEQKLFSTLESQRGSHTGMDATKVIYWNPLALNNNGDGRTFATAKKSYDFNAAGGIHDILEDNMHNIIYGMPMNTGGVTLIDEYIHIDQNYAFLRCPGRDWLFDYTGGGGAGINETLKISGVGIELSGMRVISTIGSREAITVAGDFAKLRWVWVDESKGHGILIDNASHCLISHFIIQDAALGGSGHAVAIDGTGGTVELPTAIRNFIQSGKILHNGDGGETDGVRVSGAGAQHNYLIGGEPGLVIHGNTGWGVNEIGGADHTIIVGGPDVSIVHNTLGQVNLTGANSYAPNLEPYAKETTATVIKDKVLLIPIATGANAVEIQLFEADMVTPIADAKVFIYNSDSSIFVDERTTDVNGLCTVPLDDNDYNLRIRKTGYTFAFEEVLTVVGDGTHPFSGSTYLIPEPVSPDGCNLVIDLITIGIEPHAGEVFTVQLADPPKKLNNVVISADLQEGETNAEGRILFPLVKGFKYEVKSLSLGQFEATIIDTTGQTTISLADFIEPITP